GGTGSSGGGGFAVAAAVDDVSAGAVAAGERGCLLAVLAALELSEPGPGTLPPLLEGAARDSLRATPATAAGLDGGFVEVDLIYLRELVTARAAVLPVEDPARTASDTERAVAWAVRWNAWVAGLAASAHLCNAWQQALAVSVHAAGARLSRHGWAAVMAAAERVLRRLGDAPCEPYLASPLARSCVAVIGTVRLWEIQARAAAAAAVDGGFDAITAGGNSGAGVAEAALGLSGGGVVPPRQAALLLRLLLAALLRGDGGGAGSGAGEGDGSPEAFRMRLYACGTLLLQRNAAALPLVGRAQGGVAEALAAAAEQRRQAAAVLEARLDSLMNAVARDVAADAPDWCKAAAMAFLANAMATAAVPQLADTSWPAGAAAAAAAAAARGGMVPTTAIPLPPPPPRQDGKLEKRMLEAMAGGLPDCIGSLVEVALDGGGGSAE
ncbi:unnamed protein product, partial [Phaeothamnion confervicola]